MIPAEVRAWVTETRAKQGLEPTITDPATLAELAAAVADTMVERAPGGDGHGLSVPWPVGGSQ